MAGGFTKLRAKTPEEIAAEKVLADFEAGKYGKPVEEEPKPTPPPPAPKPKSGEYAVESAPKQKPVIPSSPDDELDRAVKAQQKKRGFNRLP